MFYLYATILTPLRSFVSVADSDSEGSDITLKEMTLDSVLEVESGDENSNQANLNKWGKGRN